MCSSNNFVIGIAVSIWTVVQTSFHIIWALCGYYFYVCRIKPGNYGLVILYLTYFYKHDCGDITLNSDDIIIWGKGKKDLNILNLNDTEKEAVYDIVKTILEKAVLPKESSAAWRINSYFFTFIISDAVWIISAFLMFAGTCFQIKKCLSLLFYCPWLIVTAFIILLDVVASVHVGLDIYQIHNFTTWLNFIGVQNYKEFSNFNDHELSHIIPILPAVLLCTLFSRILIIWVLNIVHFFQIMNVAVMAFQDNLDGNNPRYQRNAGRHSNHSKTRNKDHNTNSSASRIRSWQLFYGAIESTSTTSRSSSSTSDKDCNSNKSNNRPSKSSFKDQNLDVNTLTRPPRSQNSLDSHERYISTIKDVSSKIVSDGSIYYHGYPDVAEDIDANNDRTDSVVSPVRSRLPWSYFQAVEKEYSREYCSSDIPVRHYNRFKMTHEYESYTKSRTDSTEL